ncbi:site-specific integrase [Burkholderia pyrrocinia]|uniref:site-specific integrase n=1 Tax=Burkholderia pyrrocinia TaxID=60550 RepID=UPI001576B007|nr:site-specific integrase [Burkholderia pyrrocinia]NTX30345.1 site-specific integrase [Burkholderia pyrrocinia]
MAATIVMVGRNVWRVRGDSLSPEKEFLLRWDSVLLKGCGTKYQRATLLNSAKVFFLSKYGDENIRGEEYSPRTIERAFKDIKTILRWMVRRSIWKFSKLSLTDVLEFISDRRARSAGDDDCPSNRTIGKWVNFFSEMWEIRNQYPCSLKIDVSEVEDEILASIKSRVDRPWKALDDELAIYLISGALSWIDEFGSFIVDVVHASWEQGKSEIGKTKKERSSMSEKFYNEISECEEFGRLKSKMRCDMQPYKLLSVALTLTEGACALLLLMLVGFRVSELLALNIDCLIEEADADGSSLGYIKGTAAKKGGKQRRWVAGDPVQKLVRYLIALTSFRKTVSRRSGALLVTRSPGSPLFRRNVPMRRLDRSGLVRRIKLFVCGGLIEGIPRARRFHPHMARKTFAQLAVRRDKSNLEPVAAQLGHALQSFTDKIYVGRDYELEKLLAEANRRELAEALEDLLTCSDIGGKAAPAFMRTREDVARFRGRKSLNLLIDKLIEQGVVIVPCHWGYCVYSRAHSRCDGDQSGPNEIKRAPDVCSGCHNLCVTPKQRAWWERRARDQEVFLSRDLCEQTRVIVQRRLSGARSVLASFLSKSADVEEDHEER